MSNSKPPTKGMGKSRKDGRSGWSFNTPQHNEPLSLGDAEGLEISYINWLRQMDSFPNLLSWRQSYVIHTRLNGAVEGARTQSQTRSRGAECSRPQQTHDFGVTCWWGCRSVPFALFSKPMDKCLNAEDCKHFRNAENCKHFRAARGHLDRSKSIFIANELGVDWEVNSLWRAAIHVASLGSFCSEEAGP